MNEKYLGDILKVLIKILFEGNIEHIKNAPEHYLVKINYLKSY